MMLTELKHAVDTKTAVIAQIGLGYVGLPVACMFAKAGFRTVGVDTDAARVAILNRGGNPIEGKEPGLAELIRSVIHAGQLHCTTDYDQLIGVDVVIIAVQTPVDEEDHKPRYKHMLSALSELGPRLKEGALVILESTLAPGTIQQVLVPALEEASKGTAGERFHIAHCPERVMPGRLLRNITQMDRVIGVSTPEVGEIIVALYKNIVDGTLDVTDILTAELVKTAENAYRDVQIAFANEVALVCETLGGDVWRVRELVNKSPGRNMLLPGAGVGGHCIPKDPWLLIANAGDKIEPSLIPTARSVNRSMPRHVTHLTESALQEAGVSIKDAVIAVLGYSYLENSDDTRDTPSQSYIDLMNERCGELRIHDPFVPDYQGELDEVLKGADAAVILVAHDLYRQLDWQQKLALFRTQVVIDARHVLSDDFNTNGAIVRVLGKGKSHHA